MKILKAFILSTLPICLHAQKVELKVQDSFLEIDVEQTQTELKPGWTVFDIKLKDKFVHYLNGAHAAQQTDGNTPLFHIIPATDEVLADYALIRLQKVLSQTAQEQRSRKRIQEGRARRLLHQVRRGQWFHLPTFGGFRERRLHSAKLSTDTNRESSGPESLSFHGSITV